MTMTLSGSGTITGLTAGGLPSATVTQATLATPVAGTGPAFSAYLTGNQNLTATTYTKVTINTESFDTANCFDSTTNYRFTPNVAGYYEITGVAALNSTGANPSSGFVQIYKNGSSVKSTSGSNAGGAWGGVVNGLIYMNGSTDYVELYVWATGGSGTLYVQANPAYVYFEGFLARAA